MKRYLPFVIVAVVAISVPAGGTLLYRAKRLPAPVISKDSAALMENGAPVDHIRGDSNASVTLEEFGDLQCPPCAALAKPIKQIEQDYQSRVRVIFHHFPLAIHAFARQAALAAEAAGAQKSFWAMHDLLYREQPAWSKSVKPRLLFASYAGTLGLDVDRFVKDMDSKAAAARVDADEKLGAKLGVSQTPTIFLNGVSVPSASLRPDRLRELIAEAIKEKSSR